MASNFKSTSYVKQTLIYLLKFLEFIEKHYPSKLAELFNDDIFVYANVPYKIKPYSDILKNPKDTIDFDHQLNAEIDERRAIMGADGSLLTDKNKNVYKQRLSCQYFTKNN